MAKKSVILYFCMICQSAGISIVKELGTGKDIDVYHDKGYRKLLPGIEECGILNEHERVKRVVGGHPIPMKDFPWIAQLYLSNVTASKNILNCGGTFITDRVVLTAGHCVSRIAPGMSFLSVGFGTADRRKIKICPWDNRTPNCSKKYTRKVNKIIIHENYSEGNLQSDIALVFLQRPVEFNSIVQPVCLPYTEDLLRDWDDTKLQVVGWGFLAKYDVPVKRTASDIAMETKMRVRERRYCDQFHSRQYGKLKGDRFCAGGEAGSGSCSGDSGGGLLKKMSVRKIDGKERIFQFGIVSSGNPSSCGYQGRPMIFTNVLAYMPWILKKLAQRRSSSSEEAEITESSSNEDYNSSEDKESYKDVYYDNDKDHSDPNDSHNPSKKYNVDEDELTTYEFSTGLDIDVLWHPNLNKLPKRHQCGTLIKPKPTPRPQASIPSSEDDNEYDDEEDDRVKRVVGGRVAGVGWFPFMAQIYARDTITGVADLRCGGMVISSQFILTAAHCVTELSVPYALDFVRVGNYNRNQTSECIEKECFTPEERSIIDVIVHAGYTKFTHENNIALLKLADKIEFDRSVQPVCLPLKEALLKHPDISRDSKFISAGWGRLSKDPVKSDSSSGNQTEPQKPPPFSNIPQFIDVKLRPRKDCERVYTRILGNLDRSRMCGGGESGIGECSGDGGGPLMKPFDVFSQGKIVRKYIQLGIISFNECGQEGLPTVYTNILYYMPWILDHL